MRGSSLVQLVDSWTSQGLTHRISQTTTERRPALSHAASAAQQTLIILHCIHNTITTSCKHTVCVSQRSDSPMRNTECILLILLLFFFCAECIDATFPAFSSGVFNHFPNISHRDQGPLNED